jgi:hypothetical protein
VNLPSELLPLSKVVSWVFSLCTSTDEAEAEASDLEEVPAALESESGDWQRRTRRNKLGGMSLLAAGQFYIAFGCAVSFEIRCWNAGWLVLWYELKVNMNQRNTRNNGCFVDWMILCNTAGHELIGMICYGHCITWYRIVLYNLVFLE